MLQTATGVKLPDPLHLEGWEEQDEPLATDRHSEEQAYCWMALRYLLEPAGHYVAKDRWLRMDPDDATDKLLPDLLLARDLLAQQWNVNEYLPWVVGKAPEVLAEFLSDPDGKYPVPRIQGWTLRPDGSRAALPRAADGSIASRLAPVRFGLVDDHISVVDTRTGELVLRYEVAQQLLRDEIAARWRAEQAEQREAAARRTAEAAQQRAELAQRQAETETARLRAELERLRQGGQVAGED